MSALPSVSVAPQLAGRPAAREPRPTFYRHWSDVPMDAWPWKNFTPRELASPTSGELLLDSPSIASLQALRDLMQRPIIINSAYRDPFDNRRVRGRARSEHRKGRAFDLRIGDFDRHDLLQKSRDAGFTGFGFYQTFLHVDRGRARFWYGSEEAKEIWNA